VKLAATLALVALALAYLLGVQFVRYERAAAKENDVSTAAIAPDTSAKPAKRAAALDRRWAFGGYPCPGNDCSDDKAGYRWAQAHGITDPDACTGKTGPFIEGCRVYARQQER
jgi:hypothetical protein